MLRHTITLCLLCAALPAQAAITYAIDPARSFVGAYVPVWKNAGPVDGTPDSYQWLLEWQLTRFAVSGTFALETIESAVNPGIFRLQIGELNIRTDAPDYASFQLPPTRSLGSNGSLAMSEDACYNDFFFTPLDGNWSCSGGSIGAIASESGILEANELFLQGGKSIPFIGSAFAQDPIAPLPWSDMSPANGLYSYTIHANVLPEPGTLALLLGGLLFVASTRLQRRKARV